MTRPPHAKGKGRESPRVASRPAPAPIAGCSRRHGRTGPEHRRRQLCVCVCYTRTHRTRASRVGQQVTEARGQVPAVAAAPRSGGATLRDGRA